MGICTEGIAGPATKATPMRRSIAAGILVFGLALPASAGGPAFPLRSDAPLELPTGERISGVAPVPGGAVALGEWTQVPRTGPVVTGGGGLAFDAARGELLTFGGCCYEGDLWGFRDGAWTKHPPGLLAPGGRAGVAMVYDPIRRETVMFGASQYAETWIWDGGAWRIHHQLNGPQFRNDTTMAWMPRIGKIVMFGGYPDASPDRLGKQLRDTWTWDGHEWKPVQSPVTPPSRYAAALALDPSSGDLILFGGMDDAYASLNDTWRFDGTRWSEVQTEIAPGRRSYLSMAANPALGAVELFGGYVREDFTSLGDRWFFKDREWTQELEGIENGPLPPGRIGQNLAFDDTVGRMRLFGGSWCDPTCGGVWTERLEEIEREDGTLERRLVWDETPMTWPPDRMSAGTMVADPLGRGTLMHGGHGDSSGSGGTNDTWLWKDGAWNRLDTHGAPPSRQGLSLGVHRGSKSVVLFGGLVGYQTFDPRTWVLEGETWTPRRPETSPPGRYHAAMAEDRNGNTVLFGGLDLGSPQQRLGDTWVWDGETWTQHTGPGPSPRVYPHMVYDPVRRETVLFGGSDANGVTVNETWVWDGTGWEQRAPLVSPTGRLGAALAWDPAGEQVVLFGGATCVNLGCLVQSDVWTWGGSSWLRREHPTGWPRPRWFTLAGPSEEGIVLFGGHDGGMGLPFSDTWLWRDPT